MKKPEYVEKIINKLDKAGFEAYIFCVGSALLERTEWGYRHTLYCLKGMLLLSAIGFLFLGPSAFFKESEVLKTIIYELFCLGIFIFSFHYYRFFKR